MTVGPPIGEGRTAEVYEYGDDRVVKLLRPHFGEAMLHREAELTEVASRSGAPAPEVHGIINVDGRPGVVFDRVAGKSMLALILADPANPKVWAVRLAGTHSCVLTAMPRQIRDVRDKLRDDIGRAVTVPDRLRSIALSSLDNLEGGDALLHGDFHPANVLVDGDSVTVIDWGEASRGPAEADIARTLCLLSADAIPPDLPERSNVLRVLDEFRDTYLDAALALTDAGASDVDRWMLPVLAARLGEGIEWERKPLLVRIEDFV